MIEENHPFVLGLKNVQGRVVKLLRGISILMGPALLLNYLATTWRLLSFLHVAKGNFFWQDHIGPTFLWKTQFFVEILYLYIHIIMTYRSFTIYHLPISLLLEKNTPYQLHFYCLKVAKNLGLGEGGLPVKYPRCQVEMLTGAVGLEALKIGSFGWGEHEKTGLEYSMAVDFFFGCEGTGCPESDENQEIHLELIGANKSCAFYMLWCFRFVSILLLQWLPAQSCTNHSKNDVPRESGVKCFTSEKLCHGKEIFRQHVARPYRFKRWLLVCFSTTSAYR